MSYLDVAVDFYPGKVGGVSNWVFTLNTQVGGTALDGTLRMSTAPYFISPATGVAVTPTANNSIYNAAGGGITIFTTAYDNGTLASGYGYLVWSEEPNITRFVGWDDADWEAQNIFAAVYTSTGLWRAKDRAGNFFTFTPLSTDVLIAEYYSAQAPKLTSLSLFTSNDSDVANSQATLPPQTNYLICDRTGFKVSVKEGLKQEWNGKMVRKESWEPRHPQELNRGIPREQSRGSPRPEKEDSFVEDRYPSGVSVEDLG